MTLNWQWATASMWFTVISDSGAAWHEWPQLRPHLFKSRFQIFWPQRWMYPCRRKFPGSHLFTLWERLPLELLRGRLHQPACSWDPNDDSPCLLALEQVILSSLCLSQPTFHTPPPLPPLVREPALFSQWVTNKIHRYRCPVWVDGAPRAQLLLLQLWGSSSLL